VYNFKPGRRLVKRRWTRSYRKYVSIGIPYMAYRVIQATADNQLTSKILVTVSVSNHDVTVNVSV